MLNIENYKTERLINGNIVRVITLEGQKRYKRDKKKLMKAGIIPFNNEIKKPMDYYSYCKSFGGFPFDDNNSLLKIDVNLFREQ